MTSPLEQARTIFEQSETSSQQEGQQIVQILLSGRALEDLNAEELYLLSRGYNWSGQAQRAFEVAVLQARAFPVQMDLPGLKGFLHNLAFDITEAHPNRQKVRRFVHGRPDVDLPWIADYTKAQLALIHSLPDLFQGAPLKVMEATMYLEWAIPDGECPFPIWDDFEAFPLGQWEKWDLGHILFHSEALENAAKCLAEAVRLDPNIPHTYQEEGGVWDFDFAPIFTLPQYRYLALYTHPHSRPQEGNT